MASKKTKKQATSLLTLTGLALFALIFVFTLLYALSFLQQDQSLRSNADSGGPGISILNRYKNAANNSGNKRTFTFELGAGWNFVSPPVDMNNLTAKYVCQQNAAITKLGRWNNEGDGGFVEYDCETSPAQENFDLLGNVGYFLLASTPTQFIVSGKPADDYDYSITEGWNSLGLSIVLTDPSLQMTADWLCGNVVDSDLIVTEVDRFKNGGWDAHICGLEFNRFPIKAGEGYFIKAMTSQAAGSGMPAAPLSMPN